MQLLRSSFHSTAWLHRTQQHPPCACAVIPAILWPPPQSLHLGCSGIKASTVLYSYAIIIFHIFGIRFHPATLTVSTYFSCIYPNCSLLARGHRLSALLGLRPGPQKHCSTADPKINQKVYSGIIIVLLQILLFRIFGGFYLLSVLTSWLVCLKENKTWFRVMFIKHQI